MEVEIADDDERILEFDVDFGGSVWRLRDLGGQVIREFHLNNTGEWSWQKDWIRREGQAVAGIDFSEGTRYLHADHLGSTRAITDAGGTFRAAFHFYPFGEHALKLGVTTEAMQFTGHERDEHIPEGAFGTTDDLDYMHARYYNPMLGRFLRFDPDLDSAKPGAPQTWNRYSYVAGNPLKYIDPNGAERAAVMQDVAVAQFVSGEISAKEYVETYTRPGPAGVVAIGAAGVMAGGGSLAAALGNAYRLLPTARGLAVEGILAKAFGGGLPRTFPVIDRFRNGIATSVKSLDLGAKTYQSASRLTSRLTGFIDKLANFSGGRVGQFSVVESQIQQKVLEIVVNSAKLTPEQAEAFRRAIEYAAEREIQIAIYVATIP